MRFKTDSLYLYKGNFPSTSPQVAYIWRGDLTKVFLHYRFGGLHLEGLIIGILQYYLTNILILINFLWTIYLDTI